MLERQIVNGIEVYAISNQALKYYRENAKHGGDADKDIIERKLTGLKLNAYEKKSITKDKYMCRFASFVMVVNEFTKMIEVILWDTEHHMSKWIGKDKFSKLAETYKQLGSTKNGDKYLSIKEQEVWL